MSVSIGCATSAHFEIEKRDVAAKGAFVELEIIVIGVSELPDGVLLFEQGGRERRGD